MPYHRRLKGFVTLVRNLVLAGLLYACIFAVAQTIRARSSQPTVHIAHEHLLLQERPTAATVEDGSPRVLEESKDRIKVQFPGLVHPVTIRPHANVFNRPESVGDIKDDYWGPRPHVDTEVYYPKIIDACRGNEWEAERMSLVAQCHHYLAFKQGDYTRLPAKHKRASSQDPRRAEYLNADDHDNTMDAYPRPNDVEEPTATSRGTCAGPIIPYHTYWRGSATWRLELFVKSYLYTQNVPCSRLYIWMDEDESPNLVNRTLTDSAIFRRFLPLVKRGDIVVQPWQFPTRVPMPSADQDGTRYVVKVDGERMRFDPVKPTKTKSGETPTHTDDQTYGFGRFRAPAKETPVSSGPRQEWLEFSAKQLSLLPSPPKEAIRWITLHLYGGVFLDSDVLMLRDMRPLLLPADHSFAQRWGSLTPGGEYGTSVTSLRANSSLSSYFLRGGVRMGMNFHPLVLGTMARKDGRNQDMVMLENTIFDPLWRGNGKKVRGRCQTPCLEGHEWKIFLGRNNSFFNEWRGLSGPYTRAAKSIRKTMGQQIIFNSLDRLDRLGDLESLDSLDDFEDFEAAPVGLRKRHLHEEGDFGPERAPRKHLVGEGSAHQLSPLQLDGDTFATDASEDEVLRDMGVIGRYDASQDPYPPNNRTLDHFFRGAYTYIIYGQWERHPEPNSWLDVIMRAHDGFFDRRRMNPYGERWAGPRVDDYGRWMEFL